MKKVVSDGCVNRRGLLKAGISALAAGLLLKFVGSDEVIVKKVYGADGSAVIIGGGNTGSSTTTLSSPVAGGPTAFFDSSGTGDAQAIQGRITGTSGRAFVGFASATSGSTIALDGVCNSPSGIGLRGANTATTGNAVGVQGSTESSTGAIFLGKGPGGVERVRIQQDSVKFRLASPYNIFVAGFEGNSITAGVVGGTISGGGYSSGANRVTDDYGTVGGGRDNQAGDNTGTTSDKSSATVGGGESNTASGGESTVGGGIKNIAGEKLSTVAGGSTNYAKAYAATVGGGYTNTAGGDYSTACGGQSNLANAQNSTVSGGQSNTASNDWSTVGGGESNTASGSNSTVGGGFSNIASYDFATVSGGATNMASGSCSTVGGGTGNTAAGDYSFAVGRRAKNSNDAHDGVFLFADGNDFDFTSAAANEFAARCTGGARFVSSIDGTGAPNAGVSLAAGGTSWGTICDRNLKENFTPVDGQSILERLSSIPVTQWNMKSQNKSIRHMGPMAQDFYTAFGLGEDDRHITTVDADGVALVAIQGLNLKLEEKIKEQTQVIEELRVQLQRLEQSFKLNLPFAVA